MRIVVNDLSFKYRLYSQRDALNKLLDFIQICHEIEIGSLKNVERLVMAAEIDTQFEIAPGCKLIKLLQQVLPREERAYFLSILVNRAFVGVLPRDAFVCDKKQSYACAYAVDKAVVSLMSADIFSESIIKGTIAGKEVILKNIGKPEHIFEHRNILGKRIYRANSEKHKRERWNSYGKGKIGSPMDLDDEQAQLLLDQAIEFKGRLYAKYQGKNYAFQNEQDVYYHGYIDNEFGDDVKAELDKHFWEIGND